MSTKIVNRRQSGTSLTPSIAPSYSTQDQTTAPIELNTWASSSSSSSRRGSFLSLPPAYTSSQPFNPSIHLQIETPGKPWLSFPMPPKPVPIPILSISPEDGSSSASQEEPRFTSVRPQRGSGSCYLVSGETVLSTTTYRFGPGKPPVVSLFLPAQHHDTDGEGSQPPEPWDTFLVQSTSLVSRSQRIRNTRLGTFEWRYASRGERKVLNANSLLVCERVVRVAVAGGMKEEEVRRPVAMLVRSDETRSPGSSASSAGNGGRLLVDLGAWDEADKTEREMVVVMVVTTALVMLKKEVDRRRAAQIAIMASAGTGGP